MAFANNSVPELFLIPLKIVISRMASHWDKNINMWTFLIICCRNYNGLECVTILLDTVHPLPKNSKTFWQLKCSLIAFSFFTELK